MGENGEVASAMTQEAAEQAARDVKAAGRGTCELAAETSGSMAPAAPEPGATVPPAPQPGFQGRPTPPRGICYGVGVGPGDPELMTLKAVRVLEACDVVAAPQTRQGSTLALDIARGAADLAGKEVLPLPFAMSRDAQAREAGHAQAVEAVAARLAQGKDVACVTLGDVGVFSTFAYLADGLRARGFEVRVVPGVTSFSAVAARLGEGLTEMDEPLHVIPAAACADELDALLDLPGTKVFMKSCGSLPQLVQALERRGELGRAALVANCGLPDELVRRDLADFDPQKNPGYFTTVVVR